MKRCLAAWLLAVGLGLVGRLNAAPAPAAFHISVNHTAVGEGRTVIVTARIRRILMLQRHRRRGIKLWPYVNGRQWGAMTRTNQAGVASFMLPLPQPGLARIQVAARGAPAIPEAYWIWSQRVANNQTVYFQRQFHLSGGIQAANMLITCDNAFQVFLNGHFIGKGSNLQHVHHLWTLQKYLHPGTNVLSVKGFNVDGPAGLLARLTIHTAAGVKVFFTNQTWRYMSARPTAWPGAAFPAAAGRPAHVEALVGRGAWGGMIRGWPGLGGRAVFPVGQPLPKHVWTSNTVAVRVLARKFPALPPRRHLVGIEYEPWFTPLNATWSTAEAIPLMGKYPFIPAVIRQHALWLDKMGINYIMIDWTNNLWGDRYFSQMGTYAKQLLAATTLLFKTYARLRREGIATPQVVLLLGLDNGPVTTTTALNGEMRWVYRHYVRNPQFKGLYLHYRHKPLMVIFNGGGPAFLAGKLAAGEPPISTREFTVRWMGSQLQDAPALVQAGYWSWMDGSTHPIAVYHRGQCEALTITPAFFAAGGWLAPAARARDSGFTFVRQFNTALRYRPRFLTICQWNEFAGQPKGSKSYVDSYSVQLNNDIEPTSLTSCAYRGCGGWGFYYLNLTRAFLHLYHQPHPTTTLLAIGTPHRGQEISARDMTVRWACAGKVPQGFTLRLDRRIMARDIPGFRRSWPVHLQGVAPGWHTLTLRADGGQSFFRLSYRHEARRLKHPVAAQARLRFVVR